MTAPFPRHFTSLHDLARLPWFEVRDGHLVVGDTSVRRAIDMHTHLALTYVRPPAVDLTARHDHVTHYLPPEVPLDFDVYVNKNFRSEDLRRMKRDLVLGPFSSGGMRETHTLPNLVREMGELSISRSVLLPIEMPRPLSDNTRSWVSAVRATGNEDRAICFGSIHPYTFNMRAQLDQQVALGVRGIKVHPAVQLVRPDDARAMKLYALCAERELPVLWHCGPVDIEPRAGRYMSQLRHYEKAVAESPRTTFVLGHSGALQMEQAIEIAKRHDNVWLELSSQSVPNIERLIEQLGEERLMFGSDWPFYHQAIPLAKVLMVTEGNVVMRDKILYGNAARLLRLEPNADQVSQRPSHA
jgi:uncharacterized protein